MQEQVNALKVRVFDAEEALRNERQSVTQFLQGLVEVMQVQGDEQGNVTLEAISARAKELAEREAAPVVVDAEPVAE